MQDLWQPIPFDKGMIRKYDRPGPRYTSYPTAPHFQDGFRSPEYVRLLETSARRGGPLSLYVHIPFCSKRCFFCGCHVTIARDHGRGKPYLELLDREMEQVARAAGAERREVIQIHWGGGTPTFLPPEDLAELAAILRRHFRLAPDCEVGVEVDPRECTAEHLDALQAGGFNRISMGVQDLDPQVQQAVNRIQPLELTREVIEGARRRGMESVNIDLIYGLPLQTVAGFGDTLAQVVSELAPDRLAVFNFAYLPAMIPHQRVIRPEEIPGAEEKLALLERAVEDLTAAGYIFIGMDHFAHPDDPLAAALRDGSLIRNFQGYSTRGPADLLAFGVSAISQVADGYAQNEKEIPVWQAALDGGGLPVARGLVLDADDRLRREVILGLMCQFRLEKAAVEARHGIDFDTYFAAELAELEPLAADGLVELADGHLEVTPLGRLLVRNVAMTFDAYLRQDTAVRYSRTV